MSSTYYFNINIETKDRFDSSKFLEFSDSYNPLNSDFLQQLKELTPIGEYTIQGEDSRPDLLSYNIYGDTQYWWILLMYNNIIDYSKIKTGDKILFFSISSLEGIYFTLKTKGQTLT